MARKTKIETLREQHRLAHIAFINAGSAYRAAEAALNKAERAAAERKARQPRHEYAVVLIDEHGDGNNSLFHATLAEARVDAKRYVGESEGDTTIVGTVIERVRLSDLERTTVEAYGRVSAAWLDGEPVCEFCNRVGPGRPAVMGDDTVHYCEKCRAKDAKAAQEPITSRCSHCGEPEEATGPLTDAREGRQLCEDCRGELCADADYARYDD